MNYKKFLKYSAEIINSNEKSDFKLIFIKD